MEMEQSIVPGAFGVILEVSGLDAELDKNVVVADEGKLWG
jgi:hypothetical protein